MRTRKQIASQLKAAKASAMARKKKSLSGRVAYAKPGGRGTNRGDGRGKVERTYTRRDYKMDSKESNMTAPGVDKPVIYQSKARKDPIVTSKNPRRKAIRSIEASTRQEANIQIYGIDAKRGVRGAR